MGRLIHRDVRAHGPLSSPLSSPCDMSAGLATRRGDGDDPCVLNHRSHTPSLVSRTSTTAGGFTESYNQTGRREQPVNSLLQETACKDCFRKQPGNSLLQETAWKQLASGNSLLQETACKQPASGNSLSRLLHTTHAPHIEACRWSGCSECAGEV